MPWHLSESLAVLPSLASQVALQSYQVLALFLIANMLTTCCFLPVVSGVYDCTHKWVSETGAIIGCVSGIFFTCIYGAGE